MAGKAQDRIASPVEGLVVAISLALWPLAALHRVVSDDLWWRFGAAEWMLHHGRVLDHEIASWTAAGAPWYDYEWAYDLLVLGLWRLGGGHALAVSTMVLALGAGWLLYLALRRAGAEPVLAAVFLWLALFVARGRLQARPEMITMLLLPLVVWLLWRFRSTGASGALWLLVPAMAVWANLHPGFLFGLGLLGLALVGETVEWLRPGVSAEDHGAIGARILVIGRLTMACGAASLATPRPLGPHWLALESFLGFRALGFRNLEWEPMPFGADTWPFWLLLIGTVLLLALDLRRAHAADVLSVAAFGLLAVQTQRSAALLALVAPPVAAASLRRLQPIPLGGRASAGGRAVVHAALALAALLLVPAALRTPVGPPGVGMSWGRVPVEAASWVAREGPHGRLFHHYRLGGYLGWRFGEGRPVFVDGKHIPYLPVLEEMRRAMEEGYEAFQAFLEDRGVEVAVLHYEQPPAPVVYGTDPETGEPRTGRRAWSRVWFRQADWALVHWDDVAMVKVRRRGPNLWLAEAHEIRHLDPEDWRYQVAEVAAGHLDAGPILRDLEAKLARDPGSARARFLMDRFRAARPSGSSGVADPEPEGDG